MSATETYNTKGEPESDDSHGHHPTAREYVNIALALGLLTALEVSTYFIDFGRIAIPLLVILMVIKFVMVASFFMHLKFDSKLFGRMLYTGLGFAVVLYTLTLMIFALERAPSA